MKPTIVEAALGLALIVGVVFSTALGSESCNRGKVAQATIQAAEANGAASAHQTSAQASDAKVADLEARVESAVQDVGRHKAERAALLRKLAAKVPPVPSDPDHTVAPPTQPSPVVDVRDQLIAKDAEVIQAQGKQIEDQAVVIGALTVSRDMWKATAEARTREAAGLRIALDAQKSVASSGKWVGRIQGFAIGIGAGYVAGRLR